MKILSDWGVTSNWWRGDRGEYWVIGQGTLLIIFALILPNIPSFIDLDTSAWQYLRWILTAIFSLRELANELGTFSRFDRFVCIF